MTRALALAALLLPAGALAQPDSGGRMGTLRDDARGAAPIPEAAWDARFQGLYAVEGACDEPDAVWALARGTVETGRTICTSLGKMTWEDGWLHVPAAQCSRMGKPAESRWIAFRGEEGGAVSARVEGTGAPVRLEPCPPPGG